VWIVHTDETALAERLDAFAEVLSADERIGVQRFVRPDDRVRYALGRALVRVMLSQFAPVDPREWRFRLTAHGRPELDMGEDLAAIRFNLSHTRGLIASVVAHGRDVGVDVEYIDRDLTQDIAGRYFSPLERAALEGLPAAEQARAFFDYWTLKEAYIKARGLGLTLPLRHFSFILRPGTPPAIRFSPELPDDEGSWQFVQHSPTPMHRLAVAIRSGGQRMTVGIEAVPPEVLLA
jgi:4'-phosphopantetheinyl transferase